jgi:hypothetical protein
VQPQLQQIVDELDRASARLAELVERVPDERWAVRADADRWSVGECVAHLNLTSHAFLPGLRGAQVEAAARAGGAPARLRRDLLGWVAWTVVGEDGGMRVKTPASFVPKGGGTPEQVTAEFARLQAELRACVRAADGLPITRVRVVSPFAERVRYNLYAALTILPRHQHRHLRQAEDVWQGA